MNHTATLIWNAGYMALPRALDHSLTKTQVVLFMVTACGYARGIESRKQLVLLKMGDFNPLAQMMQLYRYCGHDHIFNAFTLSYVHL